MALRLVGRVVEHLDLEQLLRVADGGDGLQQPVHHVHLVVERELDRHARAAVAGRGRRQRAPVAVPEVQVDHDVAVQAEDGQDDQGQEVQSKDREFEWAHDFGTRASSQAATGVSLARFERLDRTCLHERDRRTGGRRVPRAILKGALCPTATNTIVYPSCWARQPSAAGFRNESGRSARVAPRRPGRGWFRPNEAAERLRSLPFEDLGFANVDHHRALRRGFPEVVFGAGRRPTQVAAIVERIAAAGQNVLVTRAAADGRCRRCARPGLAGGAPRERARASRSPCAPAEPLAGRVAIVCAGPRTCRSPRRRR